MHAVALNGFFDNLCALESKLVSPFGQPTQVCLQVHRVTACITIWPGLKVIPYLYLPSTIKSHIIPLSPICPPTKYFLRVVPHPHPDPSIYPALTVPFYPALFVPFFCVPSNGFPNFGSDLLGHSDKREKGEWPNK